MKATRVSKKTRTVKPSRPCYQTDLAQHAKDCEAHAAKVLALHPENDLSPLSIKAAQAALTARFQQIAAQQERLRKETEFFDQGDEYIQWDFMQSDF